LMYRFVTVKGLSPSLLERGNGLRRRWGERLALAKVLPAAPPHFRLIAVRRGARGRPYVYVLS
jgi:hypothetical protein